MHKLFFDIKIMFFCILFKGEPMSTLYKSFLENFPDEFSIAHKIAP